MPKEKGKDYILTSILPSGIPAVAVAATVLYLSHLAEKIILAIILALTTFVLAQILTQDRDWDGARQRRDMLTVAVEIGAISSLVALLVTPSLSSYLYVDRGELLPIVIIRAGSSLFLTFLFPGYIILSVFKCYQNLGGFERLVLAYPCSLAIMICIGIAASFGAPFLLSVSTIFLLFQSGLAVLGAEIARREISSPCPASTTGIPRQDMLVLLGLLLFMAAGALIARPSMLRVTNLDIWRHLGNALTLVNGNLFVWSSPGGVTLYPWGEHLVLAVFVVISGLPVITSIVVLGLLDVMPVLAFYLMVSAAFKKNSSIPIVATFIWSMFQGFGWIMVVPASGIEGLSEWYGILLQSIFLTWQDVGRLNSLYNIFRDPFAPMLIGLLAVFILFYLVLNRNLHPFYRVFVGSIVVFGAFLIHIAEIAVFAGFLLVIVVVAKTGAALRIRDIGVAGLLGMGLVMVVDAITVAFYYLANIIFVPTILCFLLVTVVGQIRAKRTLAITRFDALTLARWKKPWQRVLLYIFAIMLIYLWGLALIVWPIGTHILITQGTYETNSALLPWFAYPLRLGVAGLLALTAVTVALTTRSSMGRSINMFLALSVTAALAGHAVSYIRSFIFLLPYWEIRFLPIVFAGVSVAAAAFLCRTSKWILAQRGRLWSRTAVKQVTLTCMLSLIITVGVASTILNVDLGRLLEQPPDPAQLDGLSGFEWDALNHIRWSRGSEDVIATVSEDSLAYLGYFTGAYGYTVRLPPFSTSVIESSSFYQLMFPNSLMDLGRVRQLYLAERDRNQLQIFNDQVLLKIAEAFPIEYSNSEVTVYRVPAFYPESMGEGVRLVKCGNIPLTLLEAVSLSGLPYLVEVEEGDGPFRGSVILLPSDFVDSGWAEHDFEDVESTNSGSGETSFHAERGVGTLRVEGAKAPTWFNAYMSMNTTLNTSEWGYLHLKVRTSPSALWGVAIWDTDEERWLPTASDLGGGFTFSHNAQQRWSEFTLNLEALYGCVNYSRLLLAGYLDEGSEGTCEWDWIRISEHSCLPVASSSHYLDWVKQGGRLVVLDCGGLGEVAAYLNITATGERVMIDRVWLQGQAITLPSLEVPEYSSADPSVEVAATFGNATGVGVPFVFQKAWGNGVIRYVLMSPLLDALESGSLETKRGVLEELGELVCAAVGEAIEEERNAARINSGLAAMISMAGEICLSSGVLATDLKGLSPTRMNLADAEEWYLDGVQQSGKELTELDLLSIDVEGKTRVQMNTAYATLFPSMHGGYTLLDTPSNCSVEWLLDGGNVTLQVLMDGSEHDIRIVEGSVTLEFSSLRCLLRNPVMVQVQGTAKLERCEAILLGKKLFQKNAIIQGFTEFDAVVSTGALHFENLTIDGQVVIEQVPVGPSIEEWLMPWPAILLSPPHIGWVIILAICITGGYGLHKKRYSERSKNK